MRIPRVTLALLTVLVSVPTSHALFMRRSRSSVPVERLLRNCERALTEHGDAASHAAVARLHTLAAARDDEGGSLPTAADGAHVLAAVQGYQRAVALDPRAQYLHGLGYALEEAARLNLGSLGSPAELRDRARALYRAAQVQARREPPSAHRLLPDYAEKLDGDTDAALARLASDDAAAAEEGKKPPGPKPKKPQPKKKDKERDAAARKRDKKPRDDIDTPVIFGPAESLAELTAPERTVTFDLAGDGRPRRWPWLKPSTGILVWDPARSGRIESARQLFGSATWWIFWPDGYRALAALDDDGDGWLSGRELDGVAVWYDRNSNGASDPGEVTPCAEAGVLRIATRTVPRPDGVLTHPRGVVLRDRVLPSFDWFTAPRSDPPRLARTP